MGHRRGLSLPELVLAVALLALCVYCMMSILPTSGQSLQQARDLEAARGFMLGEIERARQADMQVNFPVTAGGEVRVPYDGQPGHPPPPVLNNTTFTTSLTLKTLDTHGPYALHFISIRMQRADGRGAALTMSTRVVVTQ